MRDVDGEEPGVWSSGHGVTSFSRTVTRA